MKNVFIFMLLNNVEGPFDCPHIICLHANMTVADLHPHCEIAFLS